MTAEVDKTKEVKKTEKAVRAKPAKSEEMIKHALFGVAGLVAIVVIAFGTLMFLGGDEATSKAPVEEQTESAEAGREKAEPSDKAHADAEAEQLSFEDSILAALEQDESVLDAIMSNLEVLDYVPEEEEMAEEDVGMTVEDSIEAVNWLQSEKAKLAEREKELDAREKKLNVLDSQLSQKMTRLEQAESARIAKLAKLYDGMEARAVAKLIANLDDDTVVALLPRMKLKNASSVLALMPPVRGARLSRQMITIAEN